MLYITYITYQNLKLNNKKIMETFRSYREQLKLVDFIDFQEANGSKVTRNFDEITVKYNTYNIKVGDRVHLKSIDGMLEVKSLSRSGFVVTCDLWKKKFENKDQTFKSKHVFYSDFKCMAGVRNNIHN